MPTTRVTLLARLRQEPTDEAGQRTQESPVGRIEFQSRHRPAGEIEPLDDLGMHLPNPSGLPLADEHEGGAE